MATKSQKSSEQGQVAVLRSGDLLGVRDDLVTVCDRCLRATCWQGVFLCDDAYAAGIVKKPRAELIALGREHADYILTDAEYGSECVLASRESPHAPALRAPNVKGEPRPLG